MGPCFDLTCPKLEFGIQCIPEHMIWDAVPEGVLSALTSHSRSGINSIQHAQVETMRKALHSFKTEGHAMEQMAPFARAGSFAFAAGSSMAVIGGRTFSSVAVTSRSLRQPDAEPRADQEVHLQNLELRTNSMRNKRQATGATNESKKKLKLKSDEQWLWEQSQEADESTVTDVCRSQACGSHILISDVQERIRSGRPKVDSVAAPQVFDKSRDTSALFGESLVIFSCRTASLTLFRLTVEPASRAPGDYLPWSKCAMPASPADAPIPVLDAAHGRLKNRQDSQCNVPDTPLPASTARDAVNIGRVNSIHLDSDTSTFYQNRIHPADTRAGESIETAASSAILGLDTSRLWRQSDFESAVPGLEQATLKWNTCMISCESGHQLPVSSSCWSAMATDAARNRFVILQGGHGCKHWQAFEFVPQKPMSVSPDLPLMQACRNNYRFISRPIMGCSGRQISVRHRVQYTAVHEDLLFALVCPDASTCMTQRPQSMRVYSLNLHTLLWSICSPRSHDGPKMEYPVPRIQAACAHKGCKVYMHGGSAVATGHSCLNDLWEFDLGMQTWAHVWVPSYRPPIPSKLSASTSSLTAACQHTLAVDSTGSIIIHGGSSSSGYINRTVQVVKQLVNNVPGGAPSTVALAHRFRPAGIIAALCMCRARIARAVLAVNNASLIISMRSAQGEQRISAPIGVLQLYSGMLYNMVQDGICESSDPDECAPILPVNPRHDPQAVQTALRWVMGMCTMLPLDVHPLAEVLRVAEFFAMMPLRTEALCVICQKASGKHLPLLKDLHETSDVPELEAVISRLKSS